MKKKIISSLLAVAMMMSVALPSVFAATSDVAGDAKKVNKITMKDGKSEYEIKVDESINFTDKIAVYENETKLVTDHNHIRYMLNGNTGSGNTGDFRIVGGEIFAVRAGATGTLTIFDNYNASSNARVTVTLKTIAKESSYTQYAESFTFEKSSYELPYGGASGQSEGVTMKLNAHPKGTTFGKDTTQKDEILATAKNEILPKLGVALGLGTAGTAGVIAIDTAASVEGKVAVTVPAVAVAAVYTADLTTMDAGTITSAFGITVSVSFNNDEADTATDLANALNASTLGGTHLATVSGNTVVLTARTAGVDPKAAAIKVGAIVGATNIGDASIDPTTVGKDAAVVADGVQAKAVYNFTNATPVAAGSAIKIGNTGAVLATAGQTVEQQLDLWIANKAAVDVIGVGSTATRAGRIVTITQTTAADMSVTSINATTSFASNVGAGTNLDAAQMLALNFTVEYSKDDDGAYDFKAIEIKIPAAFLNDSANKAKVANANSGSFIWGTSTRTILTEKIEKFAPQTGKFTASTNLQPLEAITAVSFQIPSSIDVVVGKEVEVPVTFYPPNANVGKKALFEIKSAQNDGKPYQYAVIEGDTEVTEKVKILGVNSNAPAKAILTGRVINGALSAYATINVKAANFDTDDRYTSKIDKTAVEVSVGSIVPVSITGLPTGVTVKWTHKDDGTIALNKTDGTAVAINGKKIGTNTVTATLSNGEKFTVAVTVKAAAVVAPTTPGAGTGTNVPQTGDTLFSNLF